MTRLLSFTALVALLGGAVLVGANLPLQQADDGVSAAASPVVPVSTTTIVRRTIRSTEAFDGTLGYAGEGVIISGINGTYTRLPAVGDILTLGDEVYEVDGTNASFLMYGSRPAYRPLSRGSTNGPDVRQLETSLQLMGYLADDVTPARNFSQRTERAVKRWQRRTSQEQDGIIGPGQVTFMAGDVRITDVVPELGMPSVAGSVLAYTSSTDLVVTIDLKADRRGILAVGDEVSVELPDGSRSAGRVAEIDSVAQTLPGSSDPTVKATIELEDRAVVGDLDGAKVTVDIVRQTRPDVLSVPVDALLALREGGYALEIVDEDGSTYLTLAEVGLFDDEGVEVSGDFEAGDTVVVPS